MGNGFELRNVCLVRQSAQGSPRSLFNHVDASFRPGRLILVGGATGVGKSSLLFLLGGLLRPTQGEIRADGHAVSRWITPHRDLWRRRVGFVFQHFHLLGDLTVFENVLLAMIPGGGGLGPIKQRVHEVLERFDLSGLAGEQVNHISGGERQRAALARALVVRPRFLIADEPTAHQDARGTDHIVGILKQTAKRGAVVIVTAHDPRLLEQGFADETYLLANQQLNEVA